jgi:RecB family exonuclease
MNLSFSRINRWETCRQAYKFYYLDKVPAETTQPMALGNVVHAALEDIGNKWKSGEVETPEAVSSIYKQAFSAGKAVGLSAYGDGLGIVQRYIQGLQQTPNVVEVEWHFDFDVGKHSLTGFVDRIDNGPDGLEIIDYKTNHALYTSDELHGSLQLSIYAEAVRQQFKPKQEEFPVAFEMVRHGIRQRSSRGPAQLIEAMAYVESVGDQIESADEFPSTVSANCATCDFRRICPAYAKALTEKHEATQVHTGDFDAVAVERERLAGLVKLLSTRKDEVEEVIRKALNETDVIEAAGMKYRFSSSTSVSYPLHGVVEALYSATGQNLISRISTVDKRLLESVLKEIEPTLSPEKLTMLTGRLEMIAQKTVTPRFTATKGKK